MWMIFDGVCCLLLYFPLAVAHWRGTWDLLDLAIYPQDLLVSSWITLAIGGVGSVLSFTIQALLSDHLTYHQTHSTGYATPQLYLYVNGWLILCFWRGAWNLLDHYLGTTVIEACVSYCVCVVVTCLCGATKATTSLPLNLTMDTDDDLYLPCTRFKTKVRPVCPHLLDTIFSQCIILLSVAIWRAMWNILDGMLVPEDHYISDVLSLVLGMASCSIILAVQFPVNRLLARTAASTATRIGVGIVLNIVAGWPLLMAWRGAWDLCKELLIPDPFVGGIFFHTFGSVGLLILQGLSNVGSNNLLLDHDRSQAEELMFDFVMYRNAPTADYMEVASANDSVSSDDTT